MDVCTCCTEPKPDSLIDYTFMRKMHEDHGVEGVTPICIECSDICTEYEDVEIKV